MNAQLAQALEALKSMQSAPLSDKQYLEVCKALAANRAELPYRVFISVPGGHLAPNDPEWDGVRAASKTICGCGSDRVMLPANPRTEFEARPGEPVVLKGGHDDTMFVKPVGGDLSSVYVALWLEDVSELGEKALVFAPDPLGPMAEMNAIVGPTPFLLSEVADHLAQQKGKPVTLAAGHARAPVMNLMAADPVAGTVTIVLDKDVELVTREDMEKMISPPAAP
ncbi:MAG: hypothetical protein AAB692_01375 [Patescibacteria group bacterium]